MFAELLFTGHPYGHLPIGTEGSLRAMTLREVSAFHRARLCVRQRRRSIAVGDGSHEQLASLVERRVRQVDVAGGCARRDGGSGRRAGAASSGDGWRSCIAAARRSRSCASATSVLPRRTPDYHALLVLNMVLGGQFVSRINMNLREKKGYTYGARTAFDFRRAPGPFVLQASVQSDATADAVREAIGELRAIRGERPVTREELETGRASLTRGYPRNFETADQVGRAAAQLALYDLPDDYFTHLRAQGAGADGGGHHPRRAAHSIPPTS